MGAGCGRWGWSVVGAAVLAGTVVTILFTVADMLALGTTGPIGVAGRRIRGNQISTGIICRRRNAFLAPRCHFRFECGSGKRVVRGGDVG